MGNLFAKKRTVENRMKLIVIDEFVKKLWRSK